MKISLALPVLVLAATACASSGTQQPDAQPAASAEALGPTADYIWSGNLQPTQTRPSGATTASQRNKVFGTVSITRVVDDPRRSRARVMVNMPTRSPQQVRWAILPGRCGSNNLPLVGFEVYPLIEVNNTGRGEIDTSVAVALTATGEFHVNIYDGTGQQLDAVVSCANLRVNRR
ncbi:MAG TPA: hypothetical protein VFO55_02830 [Gemmatimonadaceae bacterium]|nr:hypothetical protein [Gemmatimonadaceae bacterium]